MQSQQKKKYLTINNTVLVSAFPGAGKSYYCNVDVDYMPAGFATDSDSSKFDKAYFPENYIEHIKQKIKEGYSRVFISSHKEVREALVQHNLPFVLIYPAKQLKQEYVERYIERGSSDQFIKLITENWDSWIDELKAQTGCHHIELQSGQFVSNVI